MAKTEWEEQQLFPDIQGVRIEVVVTLAPDRDDIICHTKVMSVPGFRQVADRVQYFNRTAPGARRALYELWDRMADPKLDLGLNLPPLEVKDDSDPF